MRVLHFRSNAFLRQPCSFFGGERRHPGQSEGRKVEKSSVNTQASRQGDRKDKGWKVLERDENLR